MSVEPKKDELSPEAAEQLCAEYERYWQRLCDGGTVDELKEHDTAADGVRAADLKVLAALHAARTAVAQDSVAPATCDFVLEESPGVAPGLSPRLPPGIRLGDYLIKELLGRGGMGEVYLAEHELMGRQVAIKVLPTDRGSSASALRRFHTEIKALARLGTHPNLAAAFDAGMHDDCIFLVVEYIPGADLKELVQRRGPLEPAKAFEYIRQAALGLVHAHEHGIVHRDIKPANLMLTPDGTIKVLDLGLAQAREATGADEGQTQAGMLLGTPDYLAPEQAEDPRQADARSDLYSLGCTWYFLLTGRPPFAGHSALSKLRAHALEPPPPIRQLRPDVPEAMAVIVDRLLCKQPQDRFASARDLAAALDTVPLRQDSAGRTGVLPPRRPFARRLALALAAGLIVIAGVVVIIRDRQGSESARHDVPEGGNALIKDPGKEAPASPPPAPKDIQVGWHIEHYRLEGKDDVLTALGRLGQPGSLPWQNDRVAIVTHSSEPAYWYVLAINPDGSPQMLLPEPGQKQDQRKPAGAFRAPLDRGRYYTLDDAGFQGLVLMASRQPLPDFDQWRPKFPPEAWKKVKTDAVWTFDGNDIGPLATQRVGIKEHRHGPTVLTDLCRRLQSRPEQVTVRAAAFMVRPK